jgi:hypothetical protein
VDVPRTCNRLSCKRLAPEVVRHHQLRNSRRIGREAYSCRKSCRCRSIRRSAARHSSVNRNPPFGPPIWRAAMPCARRIVECHTASGKSSGSPRSFANTAESPPLRHPSARVRLRHYSWANRRSVRHVDSALHCLSRQETSLRKHRMRRPNHNCCDTSHVTAPSAANEPADVHNGAHANILGCSNYGRRIGDDGRRGLLPVTSLVYFKSS